VSAVSRRTDPTPRTAPLPRAPARRLLAAHSVVVYLFLYAPIAVLAVLSFNAGMQVSLWRGFSFRWYRALVTDPEVRDGAVNSLLIAGIATVIATVVGTMAAIALARWDARSRRARSALTATRGLLYLPLIVPEIILGVALLTGFTLLQVRLSMTTVVIAHVAFTVSYVAVVVRARLAGLDRSLEEAAADLGAGPLAAFVRVTLPLAAPGIAAGALLAFTISLDDYVVTSLVAGSESQTLPVKVYSMIHNNVTPEINAVCTVLLVFTVVLTLIAQRLMRPPPG
jgi:spermidine/putrescine transport system permease protein